MLASASTELKLYNYLTGTLENNYKSLQAPDKPILNVSWCHDNSHIAILPTKGMVEVLNVESGKFKEAIPVEHTTACAFQKSKDNVAIGTAYGKLILYNLNSGLVIPSNHEVLMPVTHLEFNSTDTQMTVGGRGTEKIVLLSKFKLSSCLIMPKSTGLTAMRFHKEFNQLAAGGEDGIVNIWDTQEGNTMFSNKAHTSDVTDVTFCTNLNVMVSVSKDKSCSIQDTRTTNDGTVYAFSLADVPTSIDFIPSENFNFALSTEKGTIHIYDLRKMGASIFYWEGHDSRVNSIRFGTQSAVQFPERETTVSADGDKLQNDYKSAEELYYETDEGRSAEPEDESLCGRRIHHHRCSAESATGFSSLKTSEIDGNVAGNNIGATGAAAAAAPPPPPKMDVIFDAKQFKEDLLEEVRCIAEGLQRDVVKRVEDLKLYCSKEFAVLENLIKEKLARNEGSSETNENRSKIANARGDALFRNDNLYFHCIRR